MRAERRRTVPEAEEIQAADRQGETDRQRPRPRYLKKSVLPSSSGTWRYALYNPACISR